MNKILVTGYLGWIGRNFTKLLDENKVGWAGIDYKETDLSKTFGYFNSIVDNYDIVVHLAATPRIPKSWTYPEWYRNNNIGVTDKLASICAKTGKYLIFASSSSVYGNGEGPLNPYSWTKLAGEQSIEMYGRSLGLNYTIARIFTNYGDDPLGNLVIGKWLNNYKDNKSIIVRGNGEQTRDFIHVSDTAAALLEICLTKPNQEKLDIGTGKTHRLIDIAKIFNLPITFEPELLGYADSTEANLNKTQQVISWRPKVDLLSWLHEQLMK